MVRHLKKILIDFMTHEPDSHPVQYSSLVLQIIIPFRVNKRQPNQQH